MVESLELFKNVVNSRYIEAKNTSIVLFLNKYDVLGKKIKYSKLQKFFPDFKGDDDDERMAAEYFKGKFSSMTGPGVKLFVHFTDATDTDKIKYIFGVLQENVMVRNLKEYGCF